MKPTGIGAMLAIAHTLAFAECDVGQIRQVTVPCISGYMTFPPRTEQCILQATDDWYLARANIGTYPVGGTGGSITVKPEFPISKEQRYAISKMFGAKIRSSIDEKNLARTGELASLLQAVASGMLPLQQAASVSVSITLASWGAGFPLCLPGDTKNNCPHIFVPPVVVDLICLPSLAH